MASYYADYFKIKGQLGWIVYSDKGLFSLQLPRNSAVQPANTTLKKNGLSNKLESYFRGKNVNFNAKIDWSGYSNFEKLVLKKCRLIDYGQAVSYKELAKIVNKDGAWRAVGNALAKNRLPVIIPCHRIIKAGGGLGGFSNGSQTKKQLLELEKNGNS